MTDHSRYGIVSGHRFANDMVGQQTLVSGMGEQTGWAVLEGLACCIGRTWLRSMVSQISAIYAIKESWIQ